jgi:tetratricopeptide (TPR) repeat protein
MGSGGFAVKLRLSAVAIFLAGVPLTVFALPAPPSRSAPLQQLASLLAAGDSAAVDALLRRLAPELDADERFALDVTYRLLEHRRFAEAQEQWSRAARRVQASLRAAEGQALAPAQDRELQRRFAEVVFVQGLLTARLGDKAEALRLLRQADGYGFPPLDSPLMALAADCLDELKEYALAAQAYREIVNHAPLNAEARLRLGMALYSSGRLALAEKELAQVLRQAPGMPRIHYYLGAVLFEQKRAAEARTHLERELARDPRCSGCMAKLAHLAYLNGDDRECESWLAKAAALDGGDLEMNLVSGMLAARAGRYQAAIGHLSRAVEAAPDYAKARYQLVLAYQRAGDAAKAKEHLEVYNRLIEEQRARTIGVRGTEQP